MHAPKRLVRWRLHAETQLGSFVIDRDTQAVPSRSASCTRSRFTRASVSAGALEIPAPDEERASRPDLAPHIRAGATGLEPATSGVTGRRSNQLSYAPSAADSMARVHGRRRGAHLAGRASSAGAPQLGDPGAVCEGVNQQPGGGPRAQV